VWAINCRGRLRGLPRPVPASRAKHGIYVSHPYLRSIYFSFVRLETRSEGSYQTGFGSQQHILKPLLALLYGISALCSPSNRLFPLAWNEQLNFQELSIGHRLSGRTDQVAAHSEPPDCSPKNAPVVYQSKTLILFSRVILDSLSMNRILNMRIHGNKPIP
jgi:hypothetical protein